MFKVRLIVASTLLLSFAATGFARDGYTSHRQVHVLGLHLTDGSYIVGRPTDSSLPVMTSFAKVNIPLSQIKEIQLSNDQKTITIKFLNGDSLTGVLNFKSIELGTIVGNVTVDKSQITKMSI